MENLNKIREYLLANFNAITHQLIKHCIDNKISREDAATAILVEHLLGASTIAVISEVSRNEFLLLAGTSYDYMIAEDKMIKGDKSKINKANIMSEISKTLN